MGRMCDFCGEQRSMVYCRSDSACLCLSCDRNVHSANALSNRHSRTLLCERCMSQPAIVRCHDESASLCQNCDWSGHGNASVTSTHQRQTINCYSGCPSAAELSRIWSFVLDMASTGALDGEKGAGSVAETCAGLTNLERKSSASLADASRIVELESKSAVLMPSSTMGAPKSTTLFKELPTPPKQCCSITEDIQLFDDDDNLFGDFSMADADLNLESYEELFGYSQNFSEHLFENGGMASLFPERYIPEVGTSRQGPKAAKGPAAVRTNTMQPSCSNPMSVDSVVSCKTDPVAYPTRKDNSGVTLSFSGMTNESSNGEYQDCGVSPMVAIGEPPWCPPGLENSLTSASRDNAVRRYKEKKKHRKFDKKIRYASRKERADVRKRVKGRFVKAGEKYDYDPMCPTRSF
uniref:Uncharacterized protein n=1 Tax=Kalanchoe fedtschenkoi TaxID=63787 RepID=A0A7N0UBN9_KALFE